MLNSSFFGPALFSIMPMFAIIVGMQLTLTPIEARVLGALVEKQITTPEYYPLSLNSLVNAANQKSNRDPVLQLEEHEVRRALNNLESQCLVRSVGDSRVTKFEHRLQDAFNFYRPEIAILCELLGRAPQTPGDLPPRASRMHPFEVLESVPSALQRLEKREPPMVTVLPRQPGRKESRYAHLLGDPVSGFVLANPELNRSPITAPEAASAENSANSPEHHPQPAPQPDRFAALTDEVAELRAEVPSLQAQFAAFRKQFE